MDFPARSRPGRSPWQAAPHSRKYLKRLTFAKSEPDGPVLDAGEALRGQREVGESRLIPHIEGVVHGAGVEALGLELELALLESARQIGLLEQRRSPCAAPSLTDPRRVFLRQRGPMPG